jgi:hypothetical protein
MKSEGGNVRNVRKVRDVGKESAGARDLFCGRCGYRFRVRAEGEDAFCCGRPATIEEEPVTGDGWVIL